MKSKSNSLAGLLLALLIGLAVFGGPLARAVPIPPADSHELTVSDTRPVSSSGVGLVIVSLFSGLGLIGMAAGTVTYRNPNAVRAGTTAPTSSQVSNCVIADVTMPDAATATTIVHSLSGVSTNGLDGSPFIDYFCLTAGATPVGMGVTFSFTTNGVILNNITTAAGNGGTYRVQIWRHSIVTNYTN